MDQSTRSWFFAVGKCRIPSDMKFDELRSIGHNIADSLASGIGLLIGVYEMNVFDEARRSPEGFVEVDFLTGTSTGAPTSLSLTHAIDLYGRALASLCEKHGTSPATFKQLTARYHGGSGARFSVTVENHEGRLSTDEYIGIPGRRPRVLDPLGRIRPKQGRIRRPAVDGKVR
jgi:hypothetical protein